MADSKLRKIAANIVKQIQEDGNKKLRKELTRKVNGQVLVIITKRFNTVIEELFPTIKKATLKKILDEYELKIRKTLEEPCKVLRRVFEAYPKLQRLREDLGRTFEGPWKDLQKGVLYPLRVNIF